MPSRSAPGSGVHVTGSPGAGVPGGVIQPLSAIRPVRASEPVTTWNR